jgi:hypothetical protein
MSAVWRFSEYRNEKLLVLLALGDWANEQGVCFPSMPSIATKARITERGASGIMHQLTLDGVVEVLNAGGGRGHVRRYRIKGEACSGFDFLKGEAGSSFTAIKGEGGSSKRVKVDALKGEAGDIAIRKNHHQPSEETPKTKRADAPAEWIPADAWTGFVEMRSKIRKPLTTERAVTLIVKDLEKFKAQGHDPGTVLDQSTKNGWQGVFPLKGEPNNGSNANANARNARNNSALQDFKRRDAERFSEAS